MDKEFSVEVEREIVCVDEEYVETGEWENPYGELIGFKGSREFMVRYYGICPHCKNEINVDCVKGAYADPIYPRYCEECGAKNKE